VEYRGFEFDAETHFPVILLSYVGPQHGRIIYSYMNRHRLVICQSKLYSFEREETAPLNLFTRMLLSRPLLDYRVCHITIGNVIYVCTKWHRISAAVPNLDRSPNFRILTGLMIYAIRTHYNATYA
jgi:hypothetical protein